MSVVSPNTLKGWFITLAKPVQDQFWDWIDSFRHKSEKIGINDLETTLQSTINSFISGTAPTIIPTPQIGFQHNYNANTSPINLYVWFHTDITYLAGINPKLFLFVYRTRKRRRVQDGDNHQNVNVPFANRFVHPAHLNGINYPGSRFFNGNDGDAEKAIESEFDISSDGGAFQAYRKHRLQIRPWRYWKLTDDENGALPWPIAVRDPLDDNGDDQQDFINIGSGSKIKTRSLIGGASSKAVYCKMALTIDNPDYDAADPTKKYNIPKLIGPMSETFAMFPKIKYKHNNDTDMKQRHFVGWAIRMGTTIR